ncbi:hypothetical protein F2Q69_00027044 [Brassica cretica]|uniref:Uncharacterized protein n=1 Tax=Brassica cretica TaxID=69181 RepID=A0A8S9RVA1_BRACR|nr:hypothetical protein F2Q69_00027044 [Brassica cretica]
MNCTDPDERNIREACMKKTLDDLSNDPIAQRSCLCLERAPTLSVEMNRSSGRIFDFSRVQEKSLADEAESSSHGLASERNNGEGFTLPLQGCDGALGTSLPENVDFVVGSGGVNTEARSNRSRGSQRSKSSWVRRKQDKRRNNMLGQAGKGWKGRASWTWIRKMPKRVRPVIGRFKQKQMLFP